MEERADRTSNVWGERTPYVGDWPVRADVRVTDSPDAWVQSACVLCSHGCALDIGVKNGAIVGVRGRVTDRVNRGRLGPKGLNGWEANASPDRLRMPLLRRGRRLEPASWDEAMDLIVRRTREIRERYTAQAIGFYTSGQLFIEDYYTLSVLARAGLGTPHLDGNTRLCTATASEALKQSFGSDGQPGSFADLDTADVLFHVGQNVAETKTVLWSRVLDRRRGPSPPKVIVADPRRTMTAREADVHLALRSGTNLALLNGLLHLVISAGRIDKAYIAAHTVGFDGLRNAVLPWTPERTEEATGVPASELRRAADILGSAERLVSTVLQGVYQSHQATAAAVQVNNLHLIRGMIGRPGCAVFQMNGQPTAQNTRETGCDGGMPGFRNWENPDHMADLARRWNVDPETIAHWGPPTHALQMFRYAETGAIRMLWISGTNPAVSLPELPRIRKILARRELFLVVNDAFPTETTAFADVVLPAALWGEKTGTFTNSDRTVHLSERAVAPPGMARSDLEIFVDFARRMDFRDRDSNLLVRWSDSQGAFEAWKECSRGWPCDYSGLSYDALRRGSGIQWPCTEAAPRGTERLYADGIFPTSAARCQTYGHDLVTGAAIPPEVYKASDPAGRAILRAAEVEPLPDVPSEEYPFRVTTGRQVWHFHTRTKTGRAAALVRAAPDVIVEIGAADADPLGIREGDLVAVESTTGTLEGTARIAELAPGHLFIPFHYGWWDVPSRRRAANELVPTRWDPVSKQPQFKQGVGLVRKIEAFTPWKDAKSRSASAGKLREAVAAAKETLGLDRTHLTDQLGFLEGSEERLARAAVSLRERHSKEPDLVRGSRQIERWVRGHLEDLQTLASRFGGERKSEERRGSAAPFRSRVAGGYGVVRDLHDLWMHAQEAKMATVLLLEAVRSLRDRDAETLLDRLLRENERSVAWALTAAKHAAAQAFIVPT